MPINMPAKTGGPEALGSIIGAVSKLHEMGLLTDKTMADLAEAKQKTRAATIANDIAKDNADPNSNTSKVKALAIGGILPKLYDTETASKLLPLTQQMSGAQLDKFVEDAPALKLKLGQMAAEASKLRIEGYAETKRDQNAIRANSAYDSNIQKNYENRLDAANRVKALISAAQSGTLIPSEYLSQQLATDINMLQTPTGRTTVSGTEHMRPNTLFGKAGQLSHFISGDPKAAITPGDLSQMLQETDLLYNEVGKQHAEKFNSWVKGQPPSMRQNLVDRFMQSRQQYFPVSASSPSPTPQNVSDTTAAKAGGAIQSANANDTAMADVVMPDGKSWSIPKSNLQKALSRGAKLK